MGESCVADYSLLHSTTMFRCGGPHGDHKYRSLSGGSRPDLRSIRQRPGSRPGGAGRSVTSRSGWILSWSTSGLTAARAVHSRKPSRCRAASDRSSSTLIKFRRNSHGWGRWGPQVSARLSRAPLWSLYANHEPLRMSADRVAKGAGALSRVAVGVADDVGVTRTHDWPAARCSSDGTCIHPTTVETKGLASTYLHTALSHSGMNPWASYAVNPGATSMTLVVSSVCDSEQSTAGSASTRATPKLVHLPGSVVALAHLRRGRHGRAARVIALVGRATSAQNCCNQRSGRACLTHRPHPDHSWSVGREVTALVSADQ